MHCHWIAVIIICIFLQSSAFGKVGKLNGLFQTLPARGTGTGIVGSTLLPLGSSRLGRNIISSTPVLKKKFNVVNPRVDSDYSIVHISNQDLNMLQLREGAVVLLSGKKRNKAVAVVMVSEEVEEGCMSMHPEMVSNLRLKENQAVSATALSPQALQQAKRVVLLPFTDDLIANGLSTGNTTGGGSSKATADILFDHYLQPYFKNNFFPVFKDNIIPLRKRHTSAGAGGSRSKSKDKTSPSLSTSTIDFKVCSVLNDDDDEVNFCVVGPETEVVFEGGELDRSEEDTRAKDLAELGAAESLTFSEMGGYGKQIMQLRELVEIPLRFPELYASLGTPAATGVLLCGPSGSGKTTMAKTLANELGAELITINGPELMSKISGESEEKLRTAFKEAGKHGPCILFLDELDAIAPKRDKAGTGEVERRLVSQLITSMDELHTRQTQVYKGNNNRNSNVESQRQHNVVVIGATQRPNGIDPSLRRFGRFEQEVHLNVPDVAGRLEILKIKTGKMKLAGDRTGGDMSEDDKVKLEELAKQTHGYTGSDLSQLCSEAGNALIQEQAVQLQLALNNGEELSSSPAASNGHGSVIRPVITMNADGEEVLSPEYLSSLAVTDRHFKMAVKATHPSSLKESVVETPNVKWDDIGGLEITKQEMHETIQYPIQHADLFERFGMRPSRGVLFYGPPGCGKTMMAKAVANECGANFISIKGPELLTMWFGESEANVRELFDKARAAAPCILFFDEIDSLAKARGSSTSGGSEASDRVINQILTEIDGLGPNNKNIFIIGATNRPDVLDSAITRPGRLDQLIYIPMPDADSRRSIFAANLRKTPRAGDVNIEVLVNQTDGFSGADITEICQRAVKLAIREVILWNSTLAHSPSFADEDAPESLMQLQQRHLLEALTYARKSVNSNDLLKYAEFANNMKLDLPAELSKQMGMSGAEGMGLGRGSIDAGANKLNSDVSSAMSGAFKEVKSVATAPAAQNKSSSKPLSGQAMDALMRRIQKQTVEDQIF